MAHSQHKLLGLCRQTLRWFRDPDAIPIEFDKLPDWQRLTILSHAELASKEHRSVADEIEATYRAIATAHLGDS